MASCQLLVAAPKHRDSSKCGDRKVILVFDPLAAALTRSRRTLNQEWWHRAYVTSLPELSSTKKNVGVREVLHKLLLTKYIEVCVESFVYKRYKRNKRCKRADATLIIVQHNEELVCLSTRQTSRRIGRCVSLSRSNKMMGESFEKIHTY